MKSLFVGSFNPVTEAHTKISKYLLDKVIDYLYLIPVNSNKENLVKIEDRIKMLNLIKEDNMEVLDIYDYDIDGLFNYVVLKKIHDSKGIDSIIMGADLLLKLKTFDEYETILKNYKILVISRDEIDIKKVIKNYYEDYQENFIIIDKYFQGSSTLARDSLKNKNNKYLDKKVLDYIKKNNLYS